MRLGLYCTSSFKLAVDIIWAVLQYTKLFRNPNGVIFNLHSHSSFQEWEFNCSEVFLCMYACMYAQKTVSKQLNMDSTN